MSANPPFLTFATEKEKNNTTSIKALLAKYVYYWPVLLATTVVLLVIAFVYLQFADPVYEIKATLLVNPDKTTTSQQDGGQSVLNRIDLPNSAEIVENELAKLKSAKLINEVIRDLELTVSYKVKNGWLYDDVYYNGPFKLRMIKSDLDFGEKSQISLKITVKDEHTFLMENDAGNLQAFSFDKIVHTAMGTWKLEPTKEIINFKGALLKVTLFEPDKLTAFYQKKIDASLEDKLATAVDLTFSTNNKQKGKDIINHLIEVYNEDEIDEKNQETQNTIKFIDQRLASLTGELTGAEKDIENFKSAHKLTDITSDAKFELDKLQSNDARLNEINVQLSIVDGIEAYVNAAKNSNRAPAVIGISDPSLVSSIERLSQLQLQRDQMLATTPETSPDFEQIDSQIRTTKTAIKENVKNIKSSLTNAKNKLQSFNTTSESSISNLPTQERQFISIKRQQSIKENLYVYLLQKREEVSLSYASTVSNYKILDNAYSMPFKWPNKMIVYAIAFFAGICFPAMVIYLKHLLKGKIVDPSEIENELETTILGEISFDKDASSLTDNKGIINEQFRILRTKLHDLRSDGQQSRVTLVTSSIAGEGKSFISSNLGLVLAGAERKSILLELDLRKSAITDSFKLAKGHHGITDFLSGTVAAGDIIRPSGVTPFLDIISGGTVTSHPAELLENGKLNQLIEILKTSYDNIIIDSPPVHLVTDAFILARVSDLTLYVIRQGNTPKSELEFIKKLMKNDKFPLVNIVFNGVNNWKYGYGYTYDHTYYEVVPGK
ncbi:GumC family protein [Mucilaginibacter sp. SP1R1]|uniref:GumC family protein n=1 Tax=Mucilaginibacter sp. SP1R1 TaxID=2723091 RepID=UPI00161F91E7|nr:polysaccharide biosynthesis tyrosine autokinase [Mucilaginibacter sp. SP1R1]MBB6148315.1 capsular exopolysaccharide synthesis family protein [Mucilaginibacter sp. SP1R1]